MTRHTHTIPLWVVESGCDGEIEVEFDFIPGGATDDEDKIEVLSGRYIGDDGKPLPILVGFAAHEEDRIIDWLADEWEPPALRGEAA